METRTTLINLLFTGGTALAGLILVFLGFIINAYESYATAEKSAVRNKYRNRAYLAFWGFVLSILCIISSLLFVFYQFDFLFLLSAFTFLFSLALIVVLNVIILRSI